MPFFWFWNPPTPDVPMLEWEPFRSEIWLLLGLTVLCATALLVVLYGWRIRRFKITRPADPFRIPSRAWWLSWLLWAVVPAVVGGALYWNSFHRIFALLINPAWGAITAGLIAWLLTLILFQVLLWSPGVTPRKFLYHPRWPWRVLRQALRPTVVRRGARS